MTAADAGAPFLAALWLTIPPYERTRYSWLTAAFYPPRRRTGVLRPPSIEE